MNGSLDVDRAGPRPSAYRAASGPHVHPVPTVHPIATAASILRWAVLLAALAGVLAAALVHAAPAGAAPVAARGAIDRTRSATPVAPGGTYPTTVHTRPPTPGALDAVGLAGGRAAPFRPWPTCVPFWPLKGGSYPRGPYGPTLPSIACPVRGRGWAP